MESNVLLSPETAKCRLIEHLYTRQDSDDAHLPAYLEGKLEAVSFGAERVICICDLKWSAVSIWTRQEKQVSTVSETIYYDKKGSVHNHQGRDYNADTKRWEYWRPDQRLVEKVSYVTVTDHTERTNGTQTGQSDVMHLPDGSAEIEAWLQTLPRAESVEQGFTAVPCSPFTEEKLRPVKRKARDQAVEQAIKAVPGNRHTDFKTDPKETEIRETWQIPVYRLTFTIRKKAYSAYISAYDAELVWMPELPLTPRQQRLRTQEKQSAEKLQKVQAQWDTKSEQCQKECADKCAALEAELANVSAQTDQQVAEMNKEMNKGKEHNAVLILLLVLAVVFLLGTLPTMLFAYTLGAGRFVVLAVNLAAIVILALLLRSSYTSVKAKNQTIRQNQKSFQDNQEMKKQVLRSQIEQHKADCENEIAQLKQDCAKALQQKRDALESKQEQPLPPSERILTLLQNTALPEQARCQEILQILEEEHRMT